MPASVCVWGTWQRQELSYCPQYNQAAFLQGQLSGCQQHLHWNKGLFPTLPPPTHTCPPRTSRTRCPPPPPETRNGYEAQMRPPLRGHCPARAVLIVFWLRRKLSFGVNTVSRLPRENAWRIESTGQQMGRFPPSPYSLPLSGGSRAPTQDCPAGGTALRSLSSSVEVPR